MHQKTKSTRRACSLIIVAAATFIACAPRMPEVRAQAAPQIKIPALPKMDFSQRGLDSWSARTGLAPIRATADGVVFDATGIDDPNVVTPPIDFPANVPILMHVRVRSEQAGSLQVFYFPESGGASEAASVNLPLRAGVWEDVWARLPALGPRTRFRIDPVNARGRTVIASMTFHSRDEFLAQLAKPRRVTGRVLANAWHRVVVGSDGAIVSWKARLAHSGADLKIGELERAPELAQRLSWAQIGDAKSKVWKWTQAKDVLRGVDSLGNRLEITLRGPQMSYVYRPAKASAATLQAQMPFINDGFLDRATGRNLKPDFPALGGLTSFTSLLSGHIVTLERMKRSLMPVEISTIHGRYSRRKTQSLRLATRLGFEIVADGFSPNAPVTFSPGFSSLAMKQELPPGNAHVFTARVQAATMTPQLENGKRIPQFSVSPDRKIRSGSGSEYSLNSLLRDFYHETSFWWVSGNGGVWADWTAIELGFSDTPYRDNLRHSVGNWIVGDDGYGNDGYAYTWDLQRGWPFGPPDTRHLDSNAILITSAWRYHCWAGDKSFFTRTYDNLRPGSQPATKPNLVPTRDTLLNKMRRAMNYQLNWWNGADEGIIHASGKESRATGAYWHHGRGGNLQTGGDEKAGAGSNYYDIMPFGGKDAYASIQFYLSLNAMAQVEELFGNASRAQYLRGLMPKARAAFNNTFWLEKKGNGDGASRYAGNVDADGKVNDYGFTFLNTMAMDAGLASPRQTRAIYDWLDNGVSVGPNGERKRDIYSRWKFGARSNTIHNEYWYSYKAGKWVWNDQLQNGGADLYEAGYDIISRARYMSADSAWKRYTAMLTRYAQPDRLSGGGTLWDGARVQGGDNGPGSVGVMYSEFPESGVAAASFLYAFLGVETNVNGLTLTPRIPSELQSVRADDIDFRGATFSFEATRSALAIRCTSNPQKKTFLVNGKSHRGMFVANVPLNASTRSVILREAASRNG